MKLETKLGQLAGMLPPKQQNLDFANSNLWERLPKSDQRACHEAMAKLLCQVLASTTQENDEHE